MSAIVVFGWAGVRGGGISLNVLQSLLPSRTWSCAAVLKTATVERMKYKKYARPAGGEINQQRELRYREDECTGVLTPSGPHQTLWCGLLTAIEEDPLVLLTCSDLTVITSWRHVMTPPPLLLLLLLRNYSATDTKHTALHAALLPASPSDRRVKIIHDHCFALLLLRPLEGCEVLRSTSL